VTALTSPAKRIFAIGDIHGCDVALQVLLDEIQPSATDLLVVLGDAIDRGPSSRNTLELLSQAARHSSLIFILGNHEEMLIDVLQGGRPGFWLQHGGEETLASYRGSLRQIPDNHLELLTGAVNYWQSSSHICVHANLEPGIELADQSVEWLRWRHLTGHEFPHPTGKQIICGHTGLPGGLPRMENGWACLDTLAYTGKYLTCMELDSGMIFQSRQNGHFRKFSIHDVQP